MLGPCSYCGGKLINSDARALIAQVNKKFGPNAIVMASEIQTTFRFPTGSLSFDVALGGGWPGNQFVEVYGKESHGKTFITLKTIAANQVRDPEFLTLWIAAEHYDRDQAEALGVDSDRVIVIHTQEMEFAYQQVIDFMESKSIDCVVIDSYPALIPSEEAEKDMDEFSMALGARLTGKFFRKAGAYVQRDIDGGEKPFLGIFINQQRDKIGGFSPRGVPQTTPGGNGKNYAFYVRAEVRRGDYITEKRSGQGEVKVGQEIKINLVKNKSAPPLQVAQIDAYFRDAPSLGFLRGEYDEPKEIIIMGILFKVIEQAGAYFKFKDQKWQGRAALIQAVREDLDLRDDISALVYARAKQKDLIDQVTEEAMDMAESAGERKVAIKNG